MGLQVFNEALPLLESGFFDSSTGSGGQVLIPLVTESTRLDNLVLATDDTAANVIRLSGFNGTHEGYLGSVTLPAGQGLGGTKGLDALADAAPTTLVGLVLRPGSTMFIAFENPITAGKTVYWLLLGGRLGQ